VAVTVTAYAAIQEDEFDASATNCISEDARKFTCATHAHAHTRARARASAHHSTAHPRAHARMYVPASARRAPAHERRSAAAGQTACESSGSTGFIRAPMHRIANALNGEGTSGTTSCGTST
jgi:hypothetical protein